MTTLAEALAIARQHHQAGQLQAAERIYRQILAVDPENVDALHLLGIVAYRVGRHEVAIELFERAIKLKGTEAGFHCNLGAAFKAQGNLVEAEACYRRAMELKPDFAEAHINLGNTLTAQGAREEAVVCYRRAVELKPDVAEAHYNLGNAFKDLGKLDKAVASYRRAVELKPDLTEAHYNLGNAFMDLGNLDQAVACYYRTLKLKPDHAEAHNNLGTTFTAHGRLDEAVACHRRALELRPDFFEAHSALGNAFLAQGKPDEAVANYSQALRLKPDFAGAHSNLGGAFKDQGKLDEAVASYRRALDLKPDFARAHSNLGNTFKAQGKLDEAIASYRRALDLKPDYCEAHSNLVYTQIFCPGYDAKTIYEEHRHWNQKFAEPLADSTPPHSNERSTNRRLRIGYVSPNFRDHVIGFNLLPLFRQHDCDQFEIVCYAEVLRPDAVTNCFRSYAGVWRDVAGLTQVALAERIREDRIDILVDLTLHMTHNRLLVFARKPAPVQVTFAGYPGTTGLSAIDYRLTDQHLDPPNLYDRFYSEESIRLPNTFWCYDPPTSQPPVNSLPALGQDGITFGCLNNFCKINISVLKLWAQVLKAVDQSQLLLLAPEGSHRQHTLDLLEQEGIRPDRVTFVVSRHRQRYLELYHRIDIGLDTFPYNGHTTSLDSFWMGVPVVTLVGQTVVGRAGLSQLMNLGLPELIAETPERFVHNAVELARDLPRLSELRATLRKRMQHSPLMDAPRFARNIESAYYMMWQQWCTK